MLRIKNFGPVKNVEIPLNRFVVLIGESGSGKSTIMKTASLVKFIYKKMHQNKFFGHTEELNEKFGEFLIDSELENFLKKESEIELIIDGKSILEVKNAKLNLNYKILKDAKAGKVAMIGDYRMALPYFFTLRATPPFFVEDMASNFDKAFKKFNGKFKLETLKLELIQKSNGFFNEYYLKSKKSEVKLRNASSGEKSITALELICSYLSKKYDFDEEVPNAVDKLAKEAKTLEKSIKNSKRANLSAEQELELMKQEMRLFKQMNDIFSMDKNSTFLNIFIEEPESGIFPDQQKKIAFYLASLLKEKNKPSIMLATHSPYILTSLNNLLMAGKLQSEEMVNQEALVKLVPQKFIIERGEIDAFLLKDGKSFDLMSKHGLIVADKVDIASDSINNEFDELLALRA